MLLPQFDEDDKDHWSGVQPSFIQVLPCLEGDSTLFPVQNKTDSCAVSYLIQIINIIYRNYVFVKRKTSKKYFWAGIWKYLFVCLWNMRVLNSYFKHKWTPTSDFAKYVQLLSAFSNFSRAGQTEAERGAESGTPPRRRHSSAESLLIFSPTA